MGEPRLRLGCRLVRGRCVHLREFQAALVARIAGQDDTSIRWCYYGQWLGALEDVLAGRGAVRDDDVTARARALAQRPAGHDHAQR